MELGHQIDHLLQENHSLMQLKMSLGLEVATYRYAAPKLENFDFLTPKLINLCKLRGARLVV